MGKKVTLKQIAEIADVSLTTVHRVLNGKGGCSKEVEDKILNIAKEKGYYVSTVTSFQNRGPIHIALIFPLRLKASHLFVDRILDGYLRFRDEVSQFNVVFQEFYFDKLTIDDSLENMARILKQIYREQPVHYDGLVIYGLSITDEMQIWINRIIGSGTKVVVLERSPQGLEDICSVEVNDTLAGNLAGEMLSKCIHTTGTVLIFTQKMIKGIDPNGEICTQCLKEYKPELNVVQVPMDTNTERNPFFSEIFEKYPDVVGAYATCARHTCSILDAIEQTNIQLQAVIGSELFEESYQALQQRKLDAVIDKCPELIGYDALRLLIANLLKKEELPISHKISPRIVLRANSKMFYLAKEKEKIYEKGIYS